MRFEFDTFLLRPWQDDDVESLTAHLNNYNVWRMLSDRVQLPYTVEKAREWLAIGKAMDPAKEEVWAIAIEGAAVGGIGIHGKNDVYRKTAEIGYWLGEPFWGRGIVSQAVRRVSDYALDERGLARVEAHVFAWNPGSCRVLEKAGFNCEGILRNAICKEDRIGDMHMYAKIRNAGERSGGDLPK